MTSSIDKRINPSQSKQNASSSSSSSVCLQSIRNRVKDVLRGAGLGYFFIILVCVIWIAASFLVSRLEAHGLSPVLLSYICSSGFAVLVPLRWRRFAEYYREYRSRRTVGGGGIGSGSSASGGHKTHGGHHKTTLETRGKGMSTGLNTTGSSRFHGLRP
jgi:uncharacterized membrane protein YgcG